MSFDGTALSSVGEVDRIKAVELALKHPETRKYMFRYSGVCRNHIDLKNPGLIEQIIKIFGPPVD